MDRPWFQLHTRDLLDNKELARCDPAERFVLVGLMCLAHEGTPYGHLADDVGALTIEYMAARCVVKASLLKRALVSLEQATRIRRTGAGILYVPRMVRDEEIRLKRAEGGREALKHPNVAQRKDGHKDILPPDPSLYPSAQNEGYHAPHARTDTRSDSDSDCDSGSSLGKKTNPDVALILGPDGQGDDFESLIGIFLALGVELSHEDLRQKIAREWVNIDPHTRAQALAYAQQQAQTTWRTRPSNLIPRPWNYLRERHWTRKTPARILPQTTEKALGFERAAANFLAKDESE